MATKQNINSLQSPDGSWYGVLTDGSGNLAPTTTSSTGNIKQQNGLHAPDGSLYLTLTDGAGNLT